MGSKEQETLYLESFHRARPDLPLSGAVPSECPDFLVNLNSGRIGIEVTRFMPTVQAGAPRPEEQESLQQWTMRLARKAYQAGGGPPLHVSAHFSPYQPLTKTSAPVLAKKITQFLLACSKRMVVHVTSSFDRSIGRAFLPELDMLRATRVPTEDHGVWYAGQHGWVSHAKERDINRVVERKERRVGVYRERCDALWLLVVFDVLGGDYCVLPPAEPVAFTIRTGFERVFCLAPAGDRCVEVPASPLPTTDE